MAKFIRPATNQKLKTAGKVIGAGVVGAGTLGAIGAVGSNSDIKPKLGQAKGHMVDSGRSFTKNLIHAGGEVSDVGKKFVKSATPVVKNVAKTTNDFWAPKISKTFTKAKGHMVDSGRSFTKNLIHAGGEASDVGKKFVKSAIPVAKNVAKTTNDFWAPKIAKTFTKAKSIVGN